jgi:hypothetical protein
MSRIPRRHIVLLAISAAWFTVTWWYWDTTIPIEPLRVMALDGRLAMFLAGPSDTVLLHRQGKGVLPEYRWRTDRRFVERQVPTGPLQVCDLETGRMLSECLDGHDQILSVSFSEPVRAAVVRGDHLRVVEIGDGRSRWEVPLDRLEYVQFRSQGRILLAQRGRTLTAYDTETGSVIWTRPISTTRDYRSGPDGRMELFVVRIPTIEMIGTPGKQREVSSGKHMLYDARTGEPDPRFPEFSQPPTLSLSPDGRWLAIDTLPMGRDIFDAETGKRLWTLSGRQTTSHFMSFSPGGDELRMPYLSVDQRLGQARWNAADGAVLAEISRGASSIPAVYVGKNEAVYQVTVRGKMWYPVIQKVFEKLGLWSLNKPLTDRRTISYLADRESGATFGVLPELEQGIIATPDGRGFAMLTPTRMLYFELPPLRNWMWLWMRGLVPPVVVWVGVSAFLDWRTQRGPIRNRNPMEPQTDPDIEPSAA